MTAVSFTGAAVNSGNGSLAFLKPFPSTDHKGLCKGNVLSFYRSAILQNIERLSEGGNIMRFPLIAASKAALVMDRTNGCLLVILV